MTPVQRTLIIIAIILLAFLAWVAVDAIRDDGREPPAPTVTLGLAHFA